MIELPESPNFSVRWRLDIKNEGPKSRFYLLDMGSCLSEEKYFVFYVFENKDN